MADLIIKPATGDGNKLILQDKAGGAVLTTADAGATIASNVTGIPAAGVTGVLPAAVTGGSGLTALGTVTAGNLSNTDIVYPAGHVLQEKYASTDTLVTNNGSTPMDIGFTASITPSATDNILYVHWFLPDCRKSGNTNLVAHLYRQVNGGGYSDIEDLCNALLYTATTTINSAGTSGVYKDTSYNSTAQVDYKIKFNSGQNVTGVKINSDNASHSGIRIIEVQT
jgi:hypothetical protein